MLTSCTPTLNDSCRADPGTYVAMQALLNQLAQGKQAGCDDELSSAVVSYMQANCAVCLLE